MFLERLSLKRYRAVAHLQMDEPKWYGDDKRPGERRGRGTRPPSFPTRPRAILASTEISSFRSAVMARARGLPPDSGIGLAGREGIGGLSPRSLCGARRDFAEVAPLAPTLSQKELSLHSERLVRRAVSRGRPPRSPAPFPAYSRGPHKFRARRTRPDSVAHIVSPRSFVWEKFVMQL